MDFFSFLIQSYIICFSLTVFAFILFILFKKMPIIDIFWGINIVSTIIYLSIQSGNFNYQSFIVYLLLIMWVLRLIYHIFTHKILKDHSDMRYQKMVKTSPYKAMLKQYFIQTFFQSTVSISGYFLLLEVSLTLPILYFLTSLSIIAIFGEFISDYQLQKHRIKSSSICTTGLWKFSRHPNYLFDILFWFSITMFGLNSSLFLISLIGPSFLFITIYFITAPYTERCSIEKHGQKYLDYQNKVSYFLLLPSKLNKD